MVVCLLVLIEKGGEDGGGSGLWKVHGEFGVGQGVVGALSRLFVLTFVLLSVH